MSKATQTIHQILINRSHHSYFFYCSLHQLVFITQTFHFMQEQMYLWLFALKYPNITVKQQFTVGWLCLIFSRQLVNNEKLIIFLFHYSQGSKQLYLVVLKRYKQTKSILTSQKEQSANNSINSTWVKFIKWLCSKIEFTLNAFL